MTVSSTPTVVVVVVAAVVVVSCGGGLTSSATLAPSSLFTVDDVAVAVAVVEVSSCGGWTLLLLLDLVMVTSAQFQNLVKKEGVERERGNELLFAQQQQGGWRFKLLVHEIQFSMLTYCSGLPVNR